MIAFMEWLWFVFLLILTGYYLVIFRRKSDVRMIPILNWPGVSILIAHKNDTERLNQNLALIQKQEYPSFEIIIIDDHSNTNKKTVLEEILKNYPKVRLISNEQAGKKHAIATGVKNADYELILCTDADCKPGSDQWIRKMVEAGRGDVILGYSPIEKRKGWLNMLVRFETVCTGMNYISWAKSGKAYMGVGRNILYPRSLFLKTDPYKLSYSIPYGDDDLMVQEFAAQARIKTCDHPFSFIITEAPDSWRNWLKQKHRHLSAGHYYKKAHWWQPGLFGIALAGHWMIVLVLLIFSLWWKWLPVFLIGIIIRWVVYSKWTNKLGDKDTVLWYPLLELNYAFYLGAMGLFTMFNRRKTWN